MPSINLLPVIAVCAVLAFWVFQHYGFNVVISLFAALASVVLAYFVDLKLSKWWNSSRK